MGFDSRYSIDKLKPGSRVFIEGNSYFAEVIYSWICETNSYLSSLRNSKYGSNNSIDNIDFENSNDHYSRNNNVDIPIIMHVRELDNDTQQSFHFSNMSGNSDSLFITIPILNISIFLIDNYDHYNLYTNRTIFVLKKIGFIPTIISMGRFNREKRFHLKRFSLYYHAFPNAYLHVYHQHLPTNCQADFKDCLYDSYGHQCLPGPTIRYTEYLAQEFIYLSYLKT